jgi:hypothetical protein
MKLTLVNQTSFLLCVVGRMSLAPRPRTLQYFCNHCLTYLSYAGRADMFQWNLIEVLSYLICNVNNNI